MDQPEQQQKRRHALVGPARLWEMKRDFQIHFLKSMGLEPEHYLLDIGCGTLRGGLPLISYLNRGHYFGTEVREEVLDEGRRELTDAGLGGRNPELLLVPDCRQLTLEQNFDYIWAFSVLIHMSDEILDHTLAFVGRHLAPGGAFFANVNIGDWEGGGWQGFPVVARSLSFYEQVCRSNLLELTDLGPLKDHGHHSNVEAQDNQLVLRITSRDRRRMGHSSANL